MDVRERLETPAAQPTPDRDAGREVFRRGRRRRRRRHAVTAGGAAATLVIGVLVWPGGMPGSAPVVIDDVVGAPDSSEPDGGTEPDAHGDDAEPEDNAEGDGNGDRATVDPDLLDAPEQVPVGGVDVTVPAGTRLRSHADPVTTPCHPGTTTPTVHVLWAGIDPELPACGDEAATATSIVVAPASQMPPAYLPGEGTPDAELAVVEVELLGTTGTSETYDQTDGTEVTSYVFGELDLYLAVRGPDLTPSLIDDLLGSAERRVEDDGGSQATPTPADEDLIAWFLRFAGNPTVATVAELPFADEVALGLADELLVTRPRTRLADPATWNLDVDQLRGYVGPFSALELAAGASPADTVVSVGDHAHCASPPQPAPSEVVGHRRVSVQPDPATIDSCLAWWTVDLYLAEDGTVTAITLDLYEP